MTTIEQIGKAALNGDAIFVRALTQDLLSLYPVLAEVPKPESSDLELLAVSAAIIELLSLRRGENPPTWTQAIGALEKPVFLLRAATKMPRLREMCQDAAPYPLRRRRIYAPPDYLVFV